MTIDNEQLTIVVSPSGMNKNTVIDRERYVAAIYGPQQ